MIIDSATGAHWASSPDSFQLKEYSAAISQENGSEKQETVNEATSLLQLVKSGSHPHGLRLNGGYDTIRFIATTIYLLQRVFLIEYFLTNTSTFIILI